ncbi:MAG TPA: tetratricopeptide repeat protein, partial [Chitinophagaceae bacterium]
YEQAIQILPDISHFWDTMLETVDQLKEFNDVFDWFNKMNRKLIDNKAFRTQLAYKLLKQKEFDEAEKHFLKAMDFAKEDPWTSYNLSCLYALWNKKDQALKHFEDALNKGFDDFDHISKDTDIDSIRNESRFKQLIQKFRK